jgi:hypothetical protein
MSTSLIPPIYNKLLSLEGILTEAFAADIARNFVLGLSGAQDGPLLESWLQEPVNVSGFNQVIVNQDDVDTLVALAGPMGAIAHSDAASSLVLNNTAFVAGIASSQVAAIQIFSGDPALNYIGVGAFATPTLVGSATVMGWVAASGSAMEALAGNATAMDAVAESQVAMSEIVTSQLAVELIFSSVIAKRAMFDSIESEIAIRNSVIAMDHALIISSTVEERVTVGSYDSPPPLNTQGKWFVVQCTKLNTQYSATRGVRYYRHGVDSVSGNWADFSIAEVGIQPPYNLMPAGIGATQFGAIHGRFFTQLGVMASQGSSVNSDQAYRYINMDAEGSA